MYGRTNGHIRRHGGSETIGTFCVHWDPPMPDEIETDEEFSLKDLLRELDQLELNALG